MRTRWFRCMTCRRRVQVCAYAEPHMDVDAWRRPDFGECLQCRYPDPYDQDLFKSEEHEYRADTHRLGHLQ